MVERRMDQALVLRSYFDDYSSQLHRLGKSINCTNSQLSIINWNTNNIVTYVLVCYFMPLWSLTFELDGFPAVHNFSSMKSWFMLFLQANSSRKWQNVS